MYCPLCGGELKQVQTRNKPEPPEIKWDEPKEELDTLLTLWEEYEDNKIEREEYECTGKRCFRPDYPLYFHHPFQGIDSAPGDSWSLSWVK